MLRQTKFIFRAIYIIVGFGLAVLLVWISHDLLRLVDRHMRSNSASHHYLHKITQARIQLNQAFSTAEIAFFTQDVALYQQAVEAGNGAVRQFKTYKELDDETRQKYLSHFKLALLMIERFRPAKPNTADLKYIAELRANFDQLILSLVNDETELWDKLFVSDSLLLYKAKTSNQMLRFLYFALISFLAFAVWAAVKGQKAALAIRDSELLHRSLLTAMSEGVIFCLSNGSITAANSSAETILGYSPKGLLEKSISEVFAQLEIDDPSHARSKNQNIVDLLKAEEPISNLVVRFHAKDNFLRWASLSSQPLFEIGEEVPFGFVVSFSDITRRKQAERLILEQQQQIVFASKLSALGEMAAGVAHEINNPLTVIHAKAGLLKDLAEAGELTGTKLLEMAKSIESTAMRISKIVRGLRALARDGRNDPFEMASLGGIVDHVLEICRQRYIDHGVRLEVAPVPASLNIECRQTQVEQVLLNLLSNAYDAVVDLEERWVRIEFNALQDDLEITVSDSGPGVPKELREKIFQPFFTTKEVGKGTGLGLGISLSLVAEHNGRLTLDSSSNHTRFVVRLPLRQSKKLSKQDPLAA
ncbi:MAG: ATP-binding protein [Bdellovibrionota bacterium]